MPRLFTEDHEWIAIDGDEATVGITDYAQNQMGDIVFVELPASGAQLVKGGQAAVVESVKAASDVFAPISGTVTQGNEALEQDPSLANSSPEADGWFFRLKLADSAELSGLMDEENYRQFTEGLR